MTVPSLTHLAHVRIRSEACPKGHYHVNNWGGMIKPSLRTAEIGCVRPMLGCIMETTMWRALIVASVLLGCSYWPAYADCAVEPWSIPYLGSNTSTAMLVGSGQVCQIDPGVGGTNVITSVTISVPARNGSASVGAGGDAVLYQSQPGFTGRDSFTFTLSGSGPGGSGSSAVQVSVTVQ